MSFNYKSEVYYSDFTDQIILVESFKDYKSPTWQVWRYSFGTFKVLDICSPENHRLIKIGDL